MWRHLATMYIAEANCLMSHQYPNDPSAECLIRMPVWQRSRTPNKRVDSGDIEGDKGERIESDPKSSCKNFSLGKPRQEFGSKLSLVYTRC